MKSPNLAGRIEKVQYKQHTTIAHANRKNIGGEKIKTYFIKAANFIREF